MIGAIRPTGGDLLPKVRRRIQVRGIERTNRALFDEVETYCMFLGYPRSGHSLAGALMDAHRQAVISHELDALHYLGKNVGRDRLFSLILHQNRLFSENGSEWTGYSYKVPNQWQGRFERLRVIGDKKGGASTLRLLRSPELLERLESLVHVPVRYVHVVRNPFDNIATMAHRSDQPLEANAELYLARARYMAAFLESPRGVTTHTLYHEKLISEPEATLTQLWQFVGPAVEASYLRDCRSIVFRAPSRSRDKPTWPSTLARQLQTEIAGISFLKGYSFESDESPIP